MAADVDGFPVFLGELRPHQPGPLIQALANEVGAQAIGGLQSGRIGDNEEGVTVLADCDLAAEQFAFDVVMAVEVAGDGEGEEGTDTQRQRTQDFVADIKV
jgi:hypothetical protein